MVSLFTLIYHYTSNIFYSNELEDFMVEELNKHGENSALWVNTQNFVSLQRNDMIMCL